MRIGVVGAGGLGTHHVRILRDLAAAGTHDFAGFTDLDPQRASTIASQYAVRAYPTLDELVRDSDAISVVVPTTAHFEVAARALRAGKHVFVEKPFTVTLAEADALIALADANGVVLQVGHVERFNRAVRAAMPFIDRPQFIESDRLAPFNPRGADVAVVLDLMIHDLDLVHTLVRSPARDVQAMGIPVLTPQTDIANARLTFANGAVANITASRVSRERIRKLRLFQPNGYLSLDLASGTGEFFRMRTDVDPRALASAPRALEEFVEHIPLSGTTDEPLVLELSQFVGACRGDNPIAVTGAEGREALDAALRVVDAIEQARANMGPPTPHTSGGSRTPHA